MLLALVLTAHAVEPVQTEAVLTWLDHHQLDARRGTVSTGGRTLARTVGHTSPCTEALFSDADEPDALAAYAFPITGDFVVYEVRYMLAHGVKKADATVHHDLHVWVESDSVPDALPADVMTYDVHVTDPEYGFENVAVVPLHEPLEMVAGDVLFVSPSFPVDLGLTVCPHLPADNGSWSAVPQAPYTWQPLTELSLGDTPVMWLSGGIPL
jgi:hypothetical protein